MVGSGGGVSMSNARKLVERKSLNVLKPKRNQASLINIKLSGTGSLSTIDAQQITKLIFDE